MFQRYSRMRGAAGVSVLALLAAVPAVTRAQEAVVNFRIPAQPLGAALRAFGQASGRQLVFDEAAVQGKRSAPLIGAYAPEDGLRRLLAGTGVSVVPAAGGVLTLRPDAGATGATSLAGGGEEPAMLDQIVVTGTTSANRTVLESSVAVTVANRAALDRKAPRSTAQALEMIPGVFVEASGGEVSNNFSVRGLAGGGQQFIQLSEDGLPVFYTDALSDTILKQEVSIDRLEAVRGGTSGVLTVNGAGATINFITRKPKAQPAGTVRLTGSDFGTKRADLWYGAPIGDKWAFSVGGFYRESDGVRDPGFTGDKGGLFRASLYRYLEDGEFSVNVKVVDDHNTFLTPIPLQNSRDPTAIPGLSATSGTLISRDNAVQRVLTSAATGRSSQVNDLTDGVHTKSTSIGYNFEKKLGDAWTLRSKGRYTDFGNDFNANFSFDNASLMLASDRLDPTRSDIALMMGRFGPQGATTAALRNVRTGQIVTSTAQLAALNGNGLTAENVNANNRAEVEEYVNDFSVTHQTDRNSLTAGLLYFRSSKLNSNIGASTFVSDVKDNSDRLDVVALNGAGQVVGFLTDQGMLNYGTWGESLSRSKFSSASFYVNDEWKVTDRLRLDAGVRYELYTLRRWEGISNNGASVVPGAFDANGVDVDNIIANNYIGQFGGGTFIGQYKRQYNDFEKMAWTVGGNYRVFDNLAVYARYAEGFQAQEQNTPTDIAFAEVGARYQRGTLSASITGFSTRFKDYLFSRQPAGAVLPIEFASDIKVLGAEFDLQWRPIEIFQIQATGVIQDSKIDIKDDQGTGFASAFDGNKPERTPPVNVTVTPSLLLPGKRGEIYASYHYVGDIYSDVANSIKLPAYGVWSAGFVYNLRPNLQLSASLDNITDAVGLTEGNPRAGFVENTGSDYFFARPILGRNLMFSLNYDF